MRNLSTIALAALLLVTTEARAALTKGRPLKTGQTTTYGAVGDTTAGLSRMYNDLGNGVIKDQRTGPFWEKKSDDSGVHDKDNYYSWTDDAQHGTVLRRLLRLAPADAVRAGNDSRPRQRPPRRPGRIQHELHGWLHRHDLQLHASQRLLVVVYVPVRSVLRVARELQQWQRLLRL